MTDTVSERTDDPDGKGRAPYPGLQRAGARLPVDEYVRRIWQRRWFVVAYSTATNSAGYERSFLGQAWQLLTPLLNIAFYFFVFDLLIHTSRGIPNFIGFLAVGVFFFTFNTNTLTMGTTSITRNIGLVRALPFPRAVLPLSTTLVSLQRLLYSMLVLVPILLLTGESIRLRWLLVVPAMILQTGFCLGLAFTVARAGSKVPDLAQVLPFVTRVWIYLSGVMFSVDRFSGRLPGPVRTLLQFNPGGVFLNLARHALLAGHPAGPRMWELAIFWAIVPVAVSFLYFWRGEEEYGNV